MGAAVAAALLWCALAPSAHAVVVHAANGHFFGLTPRTGISAAAVPGAVSAHPAVASSRTATTPASWYDNLNYQGGPVLHSSAPYVIFWAPAGETIPSDQEALVQRYFTDVAADSTKSSNVYAVNRQFTDQAGFADYRQTFDPSTQVITDTDPYPTPRDATNCAASTSATCLTDTQLQSEVSQLIAAKGLPSDGSTAASELPDTAPIYFVVLPSDVDVCFSDGSGTCAGNYFCAYHSSYTNGADNVLYAAIPMLALAAGQDPKSCQYDGNPAVQEPNGSLGDVALKYISHEDSETITDPLGTGWWNSYSGNEDGDNCNDSDTNAEAFLPTLGGDAGAGTLYDQAINGNDYYLQSEWSNGDANCEMQPSAGTITPRFAVPPGPRTAGTSLSFDPSTSTASNRISSETWNFGDGTATSFHAGRTLTAASHTYAAAGDYTITLTLVDNRGNLTSTSEQISVGEGPTAAFTYSPGQPQLGGGPVSFDGGASTDAGGSIVAYAWDFGDGSPTASGATPSHTYAAGGTYLVRLTLTDSLGHVDTATGSVTVTDEPPLAAFTIGAPTPEAWQAVPFDGSSSSDPDGTIASYAWSFGDGGRASGAAPTHRYTAPGTYTVTLTVTDSAGQRASAAESVTIAPGPAAAFTTSPLAPIEGTTVAIDGTGSTVGGSGAAIQSYAWSFGDGSTATGPTATHTFTAHGTYTVRLTVTDANGASNTRSRSVTVADDPPAPAFGLPGSTLLAGSAVPFDATGSRDPDGVIASYAWNFGDGTPTAGGPTPGHTYTAPGNYTVALTVVDSDGQAATVTRTVTVHAPPQSLFTFSPALPLAGAPVSFDGTGSLEPDASTTISSYRWNFGDGTPEVSAADPNHTYAAAGTYTVTLTVINAVGLSDTSTGQVTVANGRPAATIAVLTPQPVPDRPIGFTGSSTVPSGTIVAYHWSFGDGTSAVGRVATHAYRRPGRYVVKLTVTDSSGASTITYRTITVRGRTDITSVAVRGGGTGAIVRVTVDRAGTLIAGRHVVRIAHAGTATIPIKLSAPQVRTVRRGHRVSIRVALRFLPSRGAVASASAVVAFRPAPAARGHIAAALAR